MKAYLIARLLEWSTLRGLIWLIAGLSGLSLSDTTVGDIATAIHAVFVSTGFVDGQAISSIFSAAATASGLVGKFLSRLYDVDVTK